MSSGKLASKNRSWNGKLNTQLLDGAQLRTYKKALTKQIWMPGLLDETTELALWLGLILRWIIFGCFGAECVLRCRTRGAMADANQPLRGISACNRADQGSDQRDRNSRRRMNTASGSGLTGNVGSIARKGS